MSGTRPTVLYLGLKQPATIQTLIDQSDDTRQTSGVFRISKKGAKFSLATKGEPNYVFKFFPMVKKFPKGGHGPIAPLNTPLRQTVLHLGLKLEN